MSEPYGAAAHWREHAEFLAGALQQLLDTIDSELANAEQVIHAERVAAEALAAHKRLQHAPAER